MIQIASVLPSFPIMDAGMPVASDGWDFGPVVAFLAIIAVVLIIGFAVVAAGWTIKRDV